MVSSCKEIFVPFFMKRVKGNQKMMKKEFEHDRNDKE